MKLRSFVLAAMVAFLTATAWAQGAAAGKWNASIETPQGPFAFAFDFAVDGSNLTGTMSNEFMGATPISDGKVDGNALSFKLSFAGPDGAMTINYTGVVKGDELALTSKFEGTPPGGGPAEQMFTATRAK